ncbi:hypothetical protein JOE26_000799 [Rhodococcus coprophilus]|nr:hypothetical protein [Rhodococcus coprophilus]
MHDPASGFPGRRVVLLFMGTEPVTNFATNGINGS